MTKPLTDQIIARARQFIDDDAHWLQGCSAVSIDGTAVEPHDPRAVSFCASGAMFRAAFELTNDLAKANELRHAACRQLLPHSPHPAYTLEDLNDSTIGRGTILNLFDEHLKRMPLNIVEAPPTPSRPLN